MAKPAIAIIDDYQSQGLGRVLLIDEYEESSIVWENDDVVTMEFALPLPGIGERMSDAIRRSEMYKALVEVARGTVLVRFGTSFKGRQ